jgi:hypothetical protein
MLTQRHRWSNGRLQPMRLKSSQTRGRRSGLLGGLRPATNTSRFPKSFFLSGTTFELCYSSQTSFDVFKTLKSAMYLFYVYLPSSASRTRIFRAILGCQSHLTNTLTVPNEHHELIMICPNAFMQTGRIASSRSMGPYHQDPLTQFVKFPAKPENNLLNRRWISRKENLTAHTCTEQCRCILCLH